MTSTRESRTAEAEGGIRTFDLWVDNEWIESEGSKRIPAINPATGRQWASIIEATDADVNRAVSSAAEAFRGQWSFSSALRVNTLNSLADLIEGHADELARLDVQDNGKVIRETLNQIRGVPKWFRFYAGLADKIQGATVPSDSPSAVNFTVREPLGVIGCITAWNSPLLLVAVKLAPALAAGNTVVLKPSEYTSSSTLEFARLCARAGMPPGVVNVVTGGAETGNALVTHPLVEHVSFTGSTGVGSRIGAAAGAALKGVTLELGGKSPNIVFSDANLDAAAVGVLGGIFAGAGQSCVAGSRVLVQQDIYEGFLERLRDRAVEIVIGDPLDPMTEMGPIANQAQIRKVEEYVAIAKSEGARLVCGGKRNSTAGLADGLYFEPTIFAEVDYRSRLATEEVFGPVMAVIPFVDEEEAVKIANSTEFGLAAGVWTSDLSRAHRMTKRVQSGSVFVNTYRAMSPGMPVSGFKQSGVGSENGIDAILDFTKAKSVWIETAPVIADPFKMRF